MHRGSVVVQRTFGAWGQACDQNFSTVVGCLEKNLRATADFQREVSVLLGKITILEGENATLKNHLKTLGGVVATLVDKINYVGNKFQELSSQGGLVVGRLQGVEVGVGHDVDRLAIEQSELRGQLSGLLRATKPEAAIVPPVTVNVRLDRVVDEISRGERVHRRPQFLIQRKF